ncbi:MAG: hypothetical protein K8S23_17220, partial [Candidatus Cloacimonetes bacterium]|nr:hypothetical protein [Candidatus Cloacimonadota bacterium]
MITEIPKSNAHGEMTWHAERYVSLDFRFSIVRKKKKEIQLDEIVKSKLFKKNSLSFGFSKNQEIKRKSIISFNNSFVHKN